MKGNKLLSTPGKIYLLFDDESIRSLTTNKLGEEYYQAAYIIMIMYTANSLALYSQIDSFLYWRYLTSMCT